MRFYFPAVVLLALGACDTPVPETGSGAGVGFESYGSYEERRAAREAQLRRTATLQSDTISDETPAQPPAQNTASASQPLTALAPQPLPAPVQQPTSPAQTAPVNNTNVNISDEQDFGAVSSRESIESDRERLESQRSQYVVIEPTAVPTRSGGGSATVVEFALSTTNGVGEALYRRSKIMAQSRFTRNCLKYPSPDLAQAAFLQAGGPRKDRKGLDPDGDGFACSWDPQPFRNAKTGG